MSILHSIHLAILNSETIDGSFAERDLKLMALLRKEAWSCRSLSATQCAMSSEMNLAIQFATQNTHTIDFWEFTIMLMALLWKETCNFRSLSAKEPSILKSLLATQCAIKKKNFWKIAIAQKWKTCRNSQKSSCYSVCYIKYPLNWL